MGLTIRLTTGELPNPVKPFYLTYHVFRKPENAYGLYGDEFATYERNVDSLARLVLMWPPIKQVQCAARKIDTLQHLKVIANMQNQFSPQTTILKEGDEIPDDVVLKRSHSDCGDHVILPYSTPSFRTWKHMTGSIHSDELWMKQEYVPSLRELGEWRCFIIGGRMISVIHTVKMKSGKHVWKYNQVDSFLKLDEIQ